MQVSRSIVLDSNDSIRSLNIQASGDDTKCENFHTWPSEELDYVMSSKCN